MKHNYRAYLTSEFRNNMEQNGLAPDRSKKLIIDSDEHTFSVNIDGRLCEAYYTAHYDSFGGNKLVLIGHYGFGHQRRYNFSKSIYELTN